MPAPAHRWRARFVAPFPRARISTNPTMCSGSRTATFPRRSEMTIVWGLVGVINKNSGWGTGNLSPLEVTTANGLNPPAKRCLIRSTFIKACSPKGVTVSTLADMLAELFYPTETTVTITTILHWSAPTTSQYLRPEQREGMPQRGQDRPKPGP